MESGMCEYCHTLRGVQGQKGTEIVHEWSHSDPHNK